jgi:hypothetical protein
MESLNSPSSLHLFPQVLIEREAKPGERLNTRLTRTSGPMGMASVSFHQNEFCRLNDCWILPPLWVPIVPNEMSSRSFSMSSIVKRRLVVRLTARVSTCCCLKGRNSKVCSGTNWFVAEALRGLSYRRFD